MLLPTFVTVESDPSAASGRKSEVSEWQRSKFWRLKMPQQNFGHRNSSKVGRAGARNSPHFSGAFFILAQVRGNWGGVSFTLRMTTTRWVTSVPGMV